MNESHVGTTSEIHRLKFYDTVPHIETGRPLDRFWDIQFRRGKVPSRKDRAVFDYVVRKSMGNKTYEERVNFDPREMLKALGHASDLESYNGLSDSLMRYFSIFILACNLHFDTDDKSPGYFEAGFSLFQFGIISEDDFEEACKTDSGPNESSYISWTKASWEMLHGRGGLCLEELECVFEIVSDMPASEDFGVNLGNGQKMSSSKLASYIQGKLNACEKAIMESPGRCPTEDRFLLGRSVKSARCVVNIYRGLNVEVCLS